MKSISVLLKALLPNRYDWIADLLREVFELAAGAVDGWTEQDEIALQEVAVVCFEQKFNPEETQILSGAIGILARELAKIKPKKVRVTVEQMH